MCKKMDLQRLLGLLSTTNDIDLQINLFSTISAHLMSNKSTYEVVIKCEAVYNKIQAVLSRGVQTRVVVALNFLSMLLSVDDVTSCIARAQCRTSGCLAVINDMFSNRMMFHETWKALCRCLAAACSECELNQSYCSYLIPVCVKKCSETNVDICLVLYSLLFNHKGNTEVFLKSNGISLFTREFLNNDKCLLLLTAVVQTDEGLSRIRQTKVMEDLRDLMQMYGQRSEIGQKASIILNHVNSSNKGFERHISYNTRNQKQFPENNIYNMKIEEVVDELDDTKTLIQNIMKEVYAYKLGEKGMGESAKFMRQVNVGTNDAASVKPKIPLNQLTMSRTRSGLRRKPNIPNSNNLYVASQRNYDLSRLRQNFRKYIRHKPNGDKNNHPNQCDKDFRKDLTRKAPQKSNINDDKTITTSNIIQMNTPFSKANVSGIDNQSNSSRRHLRIDLNITKNTNRYNIDIFNNTEKQTLNNVRRDTTSSFNKPSKDKTPGVDLQQSFRPIFSSTLKHEDEKETSANKMFQSTMFNSYATNKLHTTHHGGVSKSKTKYVPKVKDIKNKSLSSRLLGAINDSCTTLVKSVANIFTRKNTKIIRDDSLQSVLEEDKSCSYSFLKYMQQRDAMMKERCEADLSGNTSMFSVATQLCETCDNTAALKLKLENNEHLKQTIKKLKLGINLYGCDFKKISRTMWPRDPYMKPLALYNLYRKLIVK